MTNQNNPGQQNQNPGQKPGQQHRAAARSPVSSSRIRAAVRMRDPARTPIWIASFERSERYGSPAERRGFLFVTAERPGPLR
jgi:hypothetical protein